MTASRTGDFKVLLPPTVSAAVGADTAAEAAGGKAGGAAGPKKKGKARKKKANPLDGELPPNLLAHVPRRTTRGAGAALYSGFTSTGGALSHVQQQQAEGASYVPAAAVDPYLAAMSSTIGERAVADTARSMVLPGPGPGSQLRTAHFSGTEPRSSSGGNQRP